MLVTRRYVEQGSYLNFRVRKALDKGAEYAYVLKTKPKELMVVSIERNDLETHENPEMKVLDCDIQAFEWLFADTSREGCISLTLNNDVAYDTASSRTDYTLLNATCLVVKDMRVLAETTGRLDGLIGFAVVNAIKYNVPIIVSDKHEWLFLKAYIDKLKASVKVEKVSANHDQLTVEKYQPLLATEVRSQYGRTFLETATVVGTSIVVAGLAFLAYTSYHDAQVKEQKEIVQRIVKDPYKQYRDEINGHHVTQDIDFAVNKISEFEKLKDWYVQSIDLHEDGSYRLSFKPKFSTASLTELVKWMRENSNEKLVIKSNDYFAVNTMPAFKHDYMSAFKRYIIDTQLNFAQFKDLAQFSGFSNVTLSNSFDSTNYQTMVGTISANNIELSQVKAFYDQLAHVPIADKGLRVQRDLATGEYSISQQYKLIGQLDK
ncbi:hypothetical protein [Photobacterium leiognathi]|uniref:hypothetical protein n=1 Tax=Photobacterium leiognathi TaxID=553611 RepID=UPI0027390CB6|nr:hypothetical protein [Photobacterium leiognathi]